jgi:hypothetical protein
MDEGTVLDVIQADCSCAGVLPVEGCTDPTACNFAADANVDNGTCAYVGQGSITGNMVPTNMTQETYTYTGGTAGNSYSWSVNGGEILTAASGVDVTSIDVMWQVDGFGSVAVTETHASFDCEDQISSTINVLINDIAEWEAAGISVFPNPVSDVLNISWDNRPSDAILRIFDATGREVLTQTLGMASSTWDVTQWARGTYTLRIESTESQLRLTQPVILR